MPKCCFSDEKKFMYVDKVYNMLTMTMSFLAIKFTKVLLYYYNNKLADDVGAKVIFACIIFPTFLYVFFKFYREMRVLGGQWDGRVYKCLPPLQISRQRLERRLRYLTKVSLIY